MNKTNREPCLDQDQSMELTNLTIEMHALYRIFDHAAGDKNGKHEEARRAYQDIASLLRPICLRLDRLMESLSSH
jgi:hypothetical protein